MKKLTFIAAVAALSFAPASKVELKFSLEKDKVYVQNVTAKSTTSQKFMGMDNVVENTTTTSLYYQLREQQPKGGRYDVWYGGIEISTNSGGQVMNISSQDTEDPMGLALGSISGKKLDITISHLGKVQAIEGVEQIVNELGGAGEDPAGASGQIIEAMLSEENLSQSIEAFSGVFAGKAVKKGDSWTVQHTDVSIIPMLGEIVYTLVEINDKTAKVELKGTVRTDPDNSTTDLQGMEATFFLDGMRTGMFTVDVKTGWVIEGVVLEDMAGSITIAAGAMVPEGMTIPTEIKKSTTVRGHLE